MVGPLWQLPNTRTRSLALVIALAIAFASGSALAKPASEQAVKAEFVERFMRFVSWPADAMPDQDGALIIGVIGADSFTPYLRNVGKHRVVKGHKLQIHEIEELGELRKCHVLYIDAGAANQLLDIVEITRDRPILTISQGKSFARKGVLINFYQSEGKLRFEINVDAVQRSGLRFSSKLLRLSRIVGDRG
jgi:hypothetical protein